MPSEPLNELELTLPVDGSPMLFHMSGEFGKPSIEDKDAIVLTINQTTGNIIGETKLMVRIRKNANNLSSAERDRFISALATLNDRGMGKYSDFRNIHTDAGEDEAHGRPGFLPWHRAFILDLERKQN
ncbi:MAG TPA: tyrosinase family protein [Thermodesulfobacteriota bacterium]|jgi:tyrosinase|nr:tyrosinase family protein [Thermodesulfobacteriota bacterium]